jgi:DNA primase large subunit
MNYKLTLKDYEKYPFLESFSQEASKLTQMQLPLHRLMETTEGKKALELARLRVLLALNKTHEPTATYDKDVIIKVTTMFPSILSYGMSRMIVSCTSPFIINKYANSETEKAIRYLASDLPHVREAVEDELGFDKNSRRISLKDYVPLHLSKYGSQYKLINCKIVKGSITFNENMDTMMILREKIRSKIMRKMPLTVNPDVKELFGTIISEITSRSDEISNTNFGEVEHDDFPPCIKTIISTIKANENPTHMGRFALVSFCNKIGMTPTEIVSLFQTVKDFQVATTLYQVEHILGKHGGTVYAAPACESLKTNNICRCGNDPLCNRVKHPVGYYSAMKRKQLKSKGKPLLPTK